jgi:hypothetical protein
MSMPEGLRLNISGLSVGTIYKLRGIAAQSIAEAGYMYEDYPLGRLLMTDNDHPAIVSARTAVAEACSLNQSPEV